MTQPIGSTPTLLSTEPQYLTATSLHRPLETSGISTRTTTVGPFPTALLRGLPALRAVFNGTAPGASLRTYGGSTYATSPVINLAGGANVPFHAWVHEGRSGCGETPDASENLQFQYKTAAGIWTAFRTFNGGSPSTSNFQYMTTLPAAALHVNSQFRIHQTGGSGGSGDVLRLLVR